MGLAVTRFWCVFCLLSLMDCVRVCPRGLPTDRPMWTDESGLKECTKGNTHPPSPQWSWVGAVIPIQPPPSEIILESHQQIFFPPKLCFRCQSGPWTSASPEGRTKRAGSTLQTSPRTSPLKINRGVTEASVTSVLVSSNRTFHGHKTLKDFVRRRRWTRYLDTRLPEASLPWGR